VKLLVDMNLSPSWVERLVRHGFEAVHWSTIGAATRPDVEILTWANEHHFVVITNDLDFSAILAAGAVDGPSVVQLRTQDLLSESAARIVVRALEAHREDIERGALLSIDETGRVSECCLFAGPGICPSKRRRDCHTGSPLLPWLPCLDSRRGNRVGEPKLGSTVPLRETGVVRGLHGAHRLLHDHRNSMFLLVSGLRSGAGGALCRRFRSRAAVSAEQGARGA
jgi:predicted nuclease of predicted toxin-antitoxin system